MDRQKLILFLTVHLFESAYYTQEWILNAESQYCTHACSPNAASECPVLALNFKSLQLQSTLQVHAQSQQTCTMDSLRGAQLAQ